MQSGNETGATERRNSSTKMPVKVIELGKMDCSCVCEQLSSSNLLRLWRTSANELHYQYEAKEDDETIDVSWDNCIHLHVTS